MNVITLAPQPNYLALRVETSRDVCDVRIEWFPGVPDMPLVFVQSGDRPWVAYTDMTTDLDDKGQPIESAWADIAIIATARYLGWSLAAGVQNP